MSEGGMLGFWVSPESLEELRLTFEANEDPLEQWSCTLFGFMVHGSLSR